MIFIHKNDQGQVTDLKFSPSEGFEEASLFDDEVKKFINNNQNEELIKQILLTLDLDMVRVIEDMVDLMIRKNLILFTDLPLPVQNKLLFKRTIRENLLSPDILNHDDEELLNF